MDDSQLIKACKRQDRNAQRMLYEMYAPKMMGVCLRYCKNEETARDLLHDGFIQVLTHIGSFKGKGSFEGWLKRIFVNLAAANYRLERKKSMLMTDFEQIESDDFADSESEYYIGDITQQELSDLIRDLPTGYRTIFNLFVFEEMSHREIAQILGINEAASRSQYYRAKLLLQKKINAILKRNNY